VLRVKINDIHRYHIETIIRTKTFWKGNNVFINPGPRFSLWNDKMMNHPLDCAILMLNQGQTLPDGSALARGELALSRNIAQKYHLHAGSRVFAANGYEDKPEPYTVREILDLHYNLMAPPLDAEGTAIAGFDHEFAKYMPLDYIIFSSWKPDNVPGIIVLTHEAFLESRSILTGLRCFFLLFVLIWFFLFFIVRTILSNIFKDKTPALFTSLFQNGMQWKKLFARIARRSLLFDFVPLAAAVSVWYVVEGVSHSLPLWTPCVLCIFPVLLVVCSSALGCIRQFGVKICLFWK
jgi:hypothetical protein